MFTSHILAGVIVLAVSADASPLVDLTKIERRLQNEPVYESKRPQYCLLVFGPRAEPRVWAVLDGDVLYLDRNGNGDLTPSFPPAAIDFHCLSPDPEHGGLLCLGVDPLVGRRLPRQSPDDRHGLPAAFPGRAVRSLLTAAWRQDTMEP
ncbi:MAG: hypothetical protein ABFD16_08930 [Thermoguttaceae bacterium]|jgi:hypothetical protein